MKSAADKRVADAEAALWQAEAVRQAEENAKHAAQSGTTGTQTAGNLHANRHAGLHADR